MDWGPRVRVSNAGPGPASWSAPWRLGRSPDPFEGPDVVAGHTVVALLSQVQHRRRIGSVAPNVHVDEQFVVEAEQGSVESLARAPDRPRMSFDDRLRIGQGQTAARR